MTAIAANRPQISPHRRRQLIQLAERISGDYSPEVGPTNLLEIYDDHDITLSFEDYEDHFEGMIHFEEGRFHVYCNLRRCIEANNVRARFTLAHELGHFFIPEHHRALRSCVAPFHPSFCSEHDPEHYVEEEADLFASRMLMPESKFLAAVDRNGFLLHGTRTSAGEFGASLQATTIRCKDLMSVPCAFVWWRTDAKPWYGVSKKFRAHGLKSLKAEAANIAKDSATGLALKNVDQSEAEIYRTSSIASVWFHDAIAGSAKDIQLREEALATPFGNLTWLTCATAALSGLPSILEN